MTPEQEEAAMLAVAFPKAIIGTEAVQHEYVCDPDRPCVCNTVVYRLEADEGLQAIMREHAL